MVDFIANFVTGLIFIACVASLIGIAVLIAVFVPILGYVLIAIAVIYAVGRVLRSNY